MMSYRLSTICRKFFFPQQRQEKTLQCKKKEVPYTYENSATILEFFSYSPFFSSQYPVI